MAKRSGLGKGLEALIPGRIQFRSQQAETVCANSMIVPNPEPTSRKMNPEDLRGSGEFHSGTWDFPTVGGHARIPHGHLHPHRR